MEKIDVGVVGVLVAYNTSSEVLIETAERIATQLDRLLVYDNSDRPNDLQEAIVRADIANVEYHQSHGNAGIAAAQNKGISRAIELGAGFVLFLDDDSTFPDNGVAELLDELQTERARHPQTVGIGPLITDSRTGQELAIVWDGRFLRTGDVTSTTEVAFLLGSGALVDIKAFEQFGLFRSEYFIDHVDKEWGLRVGLLGGRLVVTKRVGMVHQLGDSPTLSSRGAVRYNHDSHIRDYYLTRNAILMMWDLRLPAVKYIDLIKLLTINSIRKMVGRNRTFDQRIAVLKGLIHGMLNLRGRRGH